MKEAVPEARGEPTRAPADRTASQQVEVWDLPLRLWHWVLAACVLVAWFTPTVSGIMGPLTTLDGERVRALESRIVHADSNAEPGEIVGRDADGLLVQCGDGPIRVVRTEPAPRD